MVGCHANSIPSRPSAWGGVCCLLFESLPHRNPCAPCHLRDPAPLGLFVCEDLDLGVASPCFRITRRPCQIKENLTIVADLRIRSRGGGERGMPGTAAGGKSFGRRVLAKVASRALASAFLLSLAQSAAVEAFSFPNAMRALHRRPGRIQRSSCGSRATMAPPNKIPGGGGGVGGGGGSGSPTYPFNIPGMMQKVGDGKVRPWLSALSAPLHFSLPRIFLDKCRGTL